MPQTSLPSAAYADSKPHYDILDGLRGVAALLVVVFHLCEAHATSHFDQLLNHGYLAVDSSSPFRDSSSAMPTTTVGGG